MNDSQELNEYLARIGSELKGRKRYRQEIIEELRSHLLDEIDDSPAGDEAATRAVHRLGPVETLAGSFNSVRRERFLRRSRVALVFGTALVLGAVTAQRSLTQNNRPSYTSPEDRSLSAGFIPRAASAITFDPMSGKVVAVLSRTE